MAHFLSSKTVPPVKSLIGIILVIQELNFVVQEIVLNGDLGVGGGG